MHSNIFLRNLHSKRLNFKQIDASDIILKYFQSPFLHTSDLCPSDSESSEDGNMSLSASSTRHVGNSDGAKQSTCGNSSKSRRRRTAFTSEQLLELEREFHAKKYLSLTERSQIATTLKLSEVQVRKHLINFTYRHCVFFEYLVKTYNPSFVGLSGENLVPKSTSQMEKSQSWIDFPWT